MSGLVEDDNLLEERIRRTTNHSAAELILYSLREILGKFLKMQQVYCDEVLKLLIEEFMPKIRSSSEISKTAAEDLFFMIPDIYGFEKIIMECVWESYFKESLVSDFPLILQRILAGEQLYTDFILHLEESLDALEEVMKRPKAVSLIKTLENRTGVLFSTLLETPAVRFSQTLVFTSAVLQKLNPQTELAAFLYDLFLRLSQTAADISNKFQASAKDFVLRKLEREFQRQFNFASSDRELVKRDVLKMVLSTKKTGLFKLTKSEPVEVLLFTDFLLIAKMDQTLLGVFNLENVVVLGESFSKIAFTIKGTSRELTLLPRNEDSRQEWVYLIGLQQNKLSREHARGHVTISDEEFTKKILKPRVKTVKAISSKDVQELNGITGEPTYAAIFRRQAEALGKKPEPQWEQVFSDVYGQYYYVNKLTGAWQWERPPELDPIPTPIPTSPPPSSLHSSSLPISSSVLDPLSDSVISAAKGESLTASVLGAPPVPLAPVYTGPPISIGGATSIGGSSRGYTKPGSAFEAGTYYHSASATPVAPPPPPSSSAPAPTKVFTSYPSGVQSVTGVSAAAVTADLTFPPPPPPTLSSGSSSRVIPSGASAVFPVLGKSTKPSDSFIPPAPPLTAPSVLRAPLISSTSSLGASSTSLPRISPSLVSSFGRLTAPTPPPPLSAFPISAPPPPPPPPPQAPSFIPGPPSAPSSSFSSLFPALTSAGIPPPAPAAPTGLPSLPPVAFAPKAPAAPVPPPVPSALIPLVSAPPVVSRPIGSSDDIRKGLKLRKVSRVGGGVAPSDKDHIDPRTKLPSSGDLGSLADELAKKFRNARASIAATSKKKKQEDDDWDY